MTPAENDALMNFTPAEQTLQEARREHHRLSELAHQVRTQAAFDAADAQRLVTDEAERAVEAERREAYRIGRRAEAAFHAARGEMTPILFG